MISARRVIVALLALVLAEPAMGAPAPDGKKQAVEHFEAGRRAYRLGNFAKAIEEWSQAYELNGDPEYLYNIGKAYQQQGNRERALFFFRSYLHADPRSANRGTVEGYIAELERPAAPASAPSGPESQPQDRVPVAPAARPRPIRAEAELLVGFPMGDYDTNLVHASPGIRLAFGYAFGDLAVHAAFRYLFERAEPDYDASHYDLGLGVEYEVALGAAASLHAGVDAVYANETIASSAITGSATGFGAVLRAGVTYRLAPPIRVGAGLGYSISRLNGDTLGDTTAAWLLLEGGVTLSF